MRAWPVSLLLAALLALGGGVTRARANSVPGWARPHLTEAQIADTGPAHSVVLLDQVEVEFDRFLARRILHRRVVRVLDAAGIPSAAAQELVEAGAIRVGFDAWTWRDGDVVGHAGGDQVAEVMPSEFGATDVRRLVLLAPHVRPGDVVVTQAEWREDAPFPLFAWTPQLGNERVARARLQVRVPKGWVPRMQGGPAGLRDEAPEPECLALGMAEVPAVAEEPMAPSFRRWAPRVVVRADDGQNADFADWAALARWLERLFGPASAAADCPADLQLDTASTSPERRVTALARRVQREVRYVAVELGMGRWQPDSAATTWRLRYGDCKAKAALLVSALAAAGVEARPVLARAADDCAVDSTTADPLQFNHAVVAVRWPGPLPPGSATVLVPGGRAWTIFDPTDISVPFGSISPAIGGTLAVIAGADGGIARLPEATPIEMGHRIRARLEGDGTLVGTLELRPGPTLSASFADEYASGTLVERRARASAMLARYWPRAVLDSFAITAPATPGDTFALVLGFHLARAASVGVDRGTFSPRFDAVDMRSPPSDSVRVLPALLGAPSRADEDWRIDLPDGWTARERSPMTWFGNAGEVSVRILATGSRVRILRHVEIRESELPASQWPLAKEVLRARYAADRLTLTIERR